MAIIPQPELFSWHQVDAASDLDRLDLVLEALPDEALMRALEDERNGHRDDYPIRAVWNSILAGVVFGHESAASLRRELRRNGALRARCGFDVFKGAKAVPPDCVYSRLFTKLFAREALIEAMFDALVDELHQLLPGFGTRLGIDSKGIDSHGRPTRHAQADGRRDTDADWGTKRYHGLREDGTPWEKIKRWFGYKLHLIVDTDYELPVAYELTRASRSDCPQMLPLVEQLAQRHPALLEQTEYLSGDKGYDATANNQALWDLYGIRPVLDIRGTWKDEAQLPRSVHPQRVDTIFYTERGDVLCRHRDDAEREQDNYTPMVYEGFEADRETLKYRCPAAAKGIPCSQRDLCNGGWHTEHGRIVRVPLHTDRRIFTPLPRHTKTWQREYKHRTAVERVNSRFDVSLGFERHYIRGLKKMRLRCGLALLVMLAMAVGRLRQNQREHLRSLVQPAA